MKQVATIGLDIAKSVFQVHGVDAEGAVVLRQRLTRSRLLGFFAKRAPCLIGLEACGSAHHWARELSALGHQVRLIRLVNEQILESDRCIMAVARSSEVGRRLMTIPGVGPVLGSALVAAVADPKTFRRGRNLAAWIGLVPRQNSSGGKERLGGITKQSDRHLRQLLVLGALAVVRYAARNGTRRPWLVRLLGRRTPKVAAVALANKNARMVWAIMTSGERYREPAGAVD